MNDHSVIHSTFSLERTYKAAPARVFAAWAQPGAKAKWFAGPDSEHRLDFRVGGHEMARGTNSGGSVLTFESTYLDIVPQARIVYSSTLSAQGKLATASITTVEMSPAGDGTRLMLTEQGTYLDGLEDPGWREEGTRQQLDALDSGLSENGILDGILNEHSASEPEIDIRSLIGEWAEGLRAKDVARRTAHYADDVLIFDVINPVQHVGLDALRQRLAQWFSTFDGPIDSEVRDLRIVADEQVAFCHCLQRFRGSLSDGGVLDMLVRYTTCLRKTGDQWLVTHEHASTPFDPATGLASVAAPPPE